MQNEQYEDAIFGTVNLDTIGECDIVVKGIEENTDIPHFHVISKDKSFDTSICIYENSYLSENESKLTDKQASIINDFIRSKKDNSLVEAIGTRIIWIGRFGDKNTKKNCPIPDYSTINKGE